MFIASSRYGFSGSRPAVSLRSAARQDLSTVFLFQGFRFDSSSGELFRPDQSDNGAPVVLGARAAALLTLLAERSGRLVTKNEIMEVVWDGRIVEDANLTVQIAALRRSLDFGAATRSLIQTIPGRGYRLVPAATRVDPPPLAFLSPSPPVFVDPGAPAERRLSGILFADIAGYSRLIGSDEEGTLRRLQTLRREVIDPAVAAHGGRIVKTTGDGMLVEFASVVNGVRSAIIIQREANAYNADLAEDRRLALRIGINLGDIVAEGDDILDDGVNIAARLESAAEPGGIWLSASAYEQVRDRINIAFVDLGEQSLRNIARPVRAYRVIPEMAAPSSVPMLSSIDMSKPVPGFAGRPAIAVLPFQNLSGDPEQEYFVDGIAEDILTRLAMWRRFPAIARRSSFSFKGRTVDVKEVGRELGVRYILEGSVRKAGIRVRITGQLIDATDGYQIWADRYDRAIADVFALQDEIADAIVTALEPAVGRAEMQRAQRMSPENLDAWDLHQQAMWCLSKTTMEDTERARALFRRSAGADPNFAAPFAGLGLLGFLEVSLGYAAAPKGGDGGRPSCRRDLCPPRRIRPGTGGGIRKARLDEAMDAVLAVDAFKLFLAYRRPWWQRAGVTKGQSVTDLPLRQCYYWATGVGSSSASPTGTNSILMATYNNAASVPFWQSLQAGPLFGPEPSAADAGDPFVGRAFAHVNRAPQRLAGSAADAARASPLPRTATRTTVEQAHAQLMQMHAVAYASEPYDAHFQDWTVDPFGAGWHQWKTGTDENRLIPYMQQPLEDEQVFVVGECWSDAQGGVQAALNTSETMLQDRLGLNWPGWLKKGGTWLGPRSSDAWRRRPRSVVSPQINDNLRTARPLWPAKSADWSVGASPNFLAEFRRFG